MQGLPTHTGRIRPPLYQFPNEPNASPASLAPVPSRVVANDSGINEPNPTAKPIEVVALPAIGTGFGGVSFTEAARQMAAAYRNFLEPPHRLDWNFVVHRQRSICYDGSRQVVR